MASKIERLRAHLKNVRHKTEAVAKNALHAGEVLVVGSAAAYAEGRMSDENGEWGYKNVPYVYMGGAVLFLTGLFAGERYGADLFSAGSGLVGSHLFRSMYETGLQSKQGGSTTGRKQFRSRMNMGLPENMRAPAPVAQKQAFGTALDGLKANV